MRSEWPACSRKREQDVVQETVVVSGAIAGSSVARCAALRGVQRCEMHDCEM